MDKQISNCVTASAIGAAIGAIFPLAMSPSFLWLGLILGSCIGYCIGYVTYDFKEVIQAFREVSWKLVDAVIAWLKKPHPFILFGLICGCVGSSTIGYLYWRYPDPHRWFWPTFIFVIIFFFFVSMLVGAALLLTCADFGGNNHFFGRKEYWYPSEYFDCERYDCGSYLRQSDRTYIPNNRIRKEKRKPVRIGYLRIYWLALVGCLVIPCTIVAVIAEFFFKAIPQALMKFIILIHSEMRIISGVSAFLGVLGGYAIMRTVLHHSIFEPSIPEVIATLLVSANLGALLGYVYARLARLVLSSFSV